MWFPCNICDHITVLTITFGRTPVTHFIISNRNHSANSLHSKHYCKVTHEEIYSPYLGL